MEFGLRYENDEGKYVVLNDDPVCLRIAISASKRIEGTDISRLKLRVFEGSSPSVKTGKFASLMFAFLRSIDLYHADFTVFTDTRNSFAKCV